MTPEEEAMVVRLIEGNTDNIGRVITLLDRHTDALIWHGRLIALLLGLAVGEIVIRVLGL